MPERGFRPRRRIAGAFGSPGAAPATHRPTLREVSEEVERGLALGLLLAEKRLNPFVMVPSWFGRVGLHEKYDGTRPAGSFAQYRIDTNKWEKLPDLPDPAGEGGRASSLWIDY